MASSYLSLPAVAFIWFDFIVVLFPSIGWSTYATMWTRSFSTNIICSVLLAGSFVIISCARFIQFVMISFDAFFIVIRILVFTLIAFSFIMIVGAKVIIDAFFIVGVVIWEISRFGVFLKTLFVLCLLMNTLK